MNKRLKDRLSLRRWEITGLIATVVIVLTIPMHILKERYKSETATGKLPVSSATFVGREKCIDCHRKEYDQWENSHHDKAMEEANDETVLGDFNNAIFEHKGIRSRFFRRGKKFFVHTQGPDGKMADFEIKYTFGYTPLQQYLVPFPGGRLQCLPIAWDVKEKKWYRLPNGTDDPRDWLHWTRGGQNWNGMCAECHSTNLKKNYDPKTDTYQTTWSEIDVSCEACHGPASRHVAWAEMPDMARPSVENYNLLVKTSGLSSRKLVELCAPCHSRRAALGDYTHAEPDLLDSLLPSLLTEELYFADGQILEEVYVYGSFTQSKMYHRDVRCSHCHNVHSVKLVKEGNALCLQCHRAREYDTGDHHFHKKKGEKGDPIKTEEGEVLFEVGSGADCVQCHMPGRKYMGPDYRPDHSFRVPRPDLSAKIRAPDACIRCHMDKTSQWSDKIVTEWYGLGRKSHYGTILDAGRKRLPGARKELIALAGDPLHPVIVRATALSLLVGYPGEESARAMDLAMMDDEALIRRTGLANIPVSGLKAYAERIAPLLYDPVRAVRIEAARALAGAPSKHLRPDQQKVLQAALKEFEASMNYSADFAFGRYNLGNLYIALQRPEEAVHQYRAAIKIDGLFYPAKVNLAMLYNGRNENDKAERFFREVVQEHPELYDAAYSLGLLLVEQENYQEAAKYLIRAAEGMPERARVHYNLGLLLQELKRYDEAETALTRALEIEPNTLDYLHAMADHYIRRKELEKAKRIALKMVEQHPTNPLGKRILGFVEREME